jgi:hypothetical protein
MNDVGKQTCPICGRLAQLSWWPDNAGYQVECEVCLRYRIADVLLTGWRKARESRQLDDSLLHYLSAATRQAAVPPTILTDNWEALAKLHRDTPFPVKASKLLKVFRDRSTQRGERVVLNEENDYPLADAGSPTELDHILRDLRDQKLVEGDYPLFAVTPAGWRKLDAIGREGTQRIFLSHAAADKALAGFVAGEIQEHLPSAEVFVASRAGDIPTGGKWLDEVERVLVTRDTYLILLTPNSIKRPWLWFETGVAWFQKFRILPICAGGLAKGEVPMPLASRQVLALENADDVRQLFRDLTTEAKDPGEFVKAIAALGEKDGGSMAAAIGGHARRKFRAAKPEQQEVVRQLALNGEMDDRQLARELQTHGFPVPMAIGDNVATETGLVERVSTTEHPRERLHGYKGRFRLNPQFRAALLEMFEEDKQE